MPGEVDTSRRLPVEHLAPIAEIALGVALMPAAAHERFDEV
jgi:hypothetical protein